VEIWKVLVLQLQVARRYYPLVLGLMKILSQWAEVSPARACCYSACLLVLVRR
jgi:hypothetical protein